jgi:hypothetical protein
LKDARKIQAVGIRMPPELRNWMAHQAVENRRSLSGELLVRLEESQRQQLKKEETHATEAHK